MPKYEYKTTSPASLRAVARKIELLRDKLVAAASELEESGIETLQTRNSKIMTLGLSYLEKFVSAVGEARHEAEVERGDFWEK